MDEARAISERLDRIDALRSEAAPAGVLLAEVRELLTEAEAWVETDRPGRRAEAALDACREAVAAGERTASTAPAA